MHVSFSSLPPKPKVAHSIKINASECTPKPKTDGRAPTLWVGRAPPPPEMAPELISPARSFDGNAFPFAS